MEVSDKELQVALWRATTNEAQHLVRGGSARRAFATCAAEGMEGVEFIGETPHHKGRGDPRGKGGRP